MLQAGIPYEKTGGVAGSPPSGNIGTSFYLSTDLSERCSSPEVELFRAQFRAIGLPLAFLS